MSIKITNELFDHIAKLSMLRIEESEILGFRNNLTTMLKYIDELDELNLEDVKPFSNPICEHLEKYVDFNDLRDDEIIPFLNNIEEIN